VHAFGSRARLPRSKLPLVLLGGVLLLIDNPEPVSKDLLHGVRGRALRSYACALLVSIGRSDSFAVRAAVNASQVFNLPRCLSKRRGSRSEHHSHDWQDQTAA